jgi:hypothetical protein
VKKMTVVTDKISSMINGKRVITKKPELLAPAGNLEKLKIMQILLLLKLSRLIIGSIG